LTLQYLPLALLLVIQGTALAQHVAKPYLVRSIPVLTFGVLSCFV
jgi:hypothetical protein